MCMLQVSAEWRINKNKYNIYIHVSVYMYMYIAICIFMARLVLFLTHLITKRVTKCVNC